MVNSSTENKILSDEFRPKYVYKYCSAERAIKILTNDYIYLAPPDYQNDIYEFTWRSVFKDHKDSKHKFWARNLIAQSKQIGFDLSFDEDMKMAKKKNKDLNEYYDEYKNKIKKLLSDIRKHSGITCFSALPNSQVMWGNYADNHKGACIEFKTSDQNSPIIPNLYPVVYLTEDVRCGKARPMWKWLND